MSHVCAEHNDLVVNFSFARPPITTLCGSTKFKQAYEQVTKRLTLEGEIILTCGLFAWADGIQLLEAEKRFLDMLHLQKIELSDGIFVINVNNYIGESTRREINYAEQLAKEVRYLEPINRREMTHDDSKYNYQPSLLD